MVWIEPLISSIKGLWVNDLIGKVAIITGCVLSAHGIIHFLESILYPMPLISVIITLAAGIFFGIGTYFIYAISYSSYKRK